MRKRRIKWSAIGILLECISLFLAGMQWACNWPEWMAWPIVCVTFIGLIAAMPVLKIRRK